MEHPAFCQHCGAGLGAGARFCSGCGTTVGGEAAAEVSTLSRGLAALRCGDLDGALPLLAEAAEDGSGAALLAYGTALMRRRHYAEAIGPLERVADLLPERGEPLAYLAMAQLHTLDPTGARATMKEALAVAPQSFAVRLKHTELLLRLGYYREGLVEAEATLRLRAPDAESLAYAEHLAALARQKAPQSYTRPVGRLPRLALPRFIRRSSASRAPAVPQPNTP
jgi:tetratricopeptide (TPR) repeat protein